MLEKKYLITIIIIILLVLAGCSYITPPTNTQTPIRTQEAQITNSPTPTPLPPTETVIPTSTPTPTISITNTPNHSPIPAIGQVNIPYADSLNTNGVFWIPDNSSRALLEKYGGFCVKNTGEKRIYLTYNLGTEFGLTNELLDILKEKNVKASFFPIGSYVRDNVSIIKRLVEEGHLLCSHGESHDNQTTIKNWPTEKLIKDFEALQKRYQNIFGEDFRIHYYRPPYGYYSERNLYIARTLGYTPVFWSFTYADWDSSKPIGADKAYDIYMDNLHDGIVLQLHITTRDSVELLDRFIDNARALGYEFYRVDDIK